MNKSDYNGVYEELVELLGLENTLKSNNNILENRDFRK